MTTGTTTNQTPLGLRNEPGNPVQLRSAICDAMARLCAARYGQGLRALVLTGSMARNEASFVLTEGGVSLLGDAEFFLVFHEGFPLPTPEERASLESEAAQCLAGQRIFGHVELVGAYPTYLRQLTPRILAHELRCCGQVILGEPAILSLIPCFTAADIPLEDAWRLLANRIIEQLEVAEAFAPEVDWLPPEVGYRTVKLYLDMATSLLLFAGVYAPSYRERAERLGAMARNAGDNGHWPFPLESFAQRVAECTAWKLSPHQPVWKRDFWESAVEHASRLWRWELAQLTAASVDLPFRALMNAWMSAQPFRERLKGWLRVVRESGGFGSFRRWPRWARLARCGSPRYWVYAAAAELFFQLPDLVRLSPPDLSPAQWQEIRGWLPEVTQSGTPGSGTGQEEPNWKRLAAGVVWNYRRFLLRTVT